MEKFLGEVPTTSTIAQYFHGAIRSQGNVLLTYTSDNITLLVTDRTPFHPVDNNWPDQPGDRGTITTGDAIATVLDTFTWPLPLNTAQPHYDPSFKVKRSDTNHVILIAHLIGNTIINGEERPASLIYDYVAPGTEVVLQVNQTYRDSLDKSHSASHLMALALNKITSPLWSKRTINDSLGNADFDKFAISKANIQPYRSLDIYRLGKSLRKAGFDSSGLLSDLGQISKAVTDTVNIWISTNADADILMVSVGLTFGSARYWTVTLDGQEVSIPCGGTHPNKLGAIGKVTVDLQANSNADELTIETICS